MEKTLGLLGILGIMLASSLTIMVGSAITPALPQIGEYFQLGNYSSWLVTIPALGVVISAIPCGKFLNKFGAYLSCTIGLLIYGLLGISGCIMPEAISEFVVRFLLGIATALIMTSSTALISIFYKGEKQLKMIAIQGMAIEFGGVIFLSISGVIAQFSWRSPYLIYGIAFIALLLLLFFVPNKKDTSDKNEKQSNVSKQQEVSEKKESVYPVFLFAFLGMLIFFTAIISLPTYLQNEKGYSTVFTGNYLSAISLIAVVFAGIMPKVVTRFTARGSLMIAYFSYAIGHGLFFFSDSSLFLYIAALFMGIGFGFSTPLVNHLTVERSTEETKARNLSYYSMATFLGQFLCSMIVLAVTGKMIFLASSIIALLTFFGALFAFSSKKKSYNLQIRTLWNKVLSIVAQN